MPIAFNRFLMACGVIPATAAIFLSDCLSSVHNLAVSAIVIVSFIGMYSRLINFIGQHYQFQKNKAMITLLTDMGYYVTSINHLIVSNPSTVSIVSLAAFSTTGM